MNNSWDNKFGLIKSNDGTVYSVTNGNVSKLVEGVGKDEPIVENAQGGKQSRSLYATHLIDPDFLDAMSDEEGPLHHIAEFMKHPECATPLFLAIEEATKDDDISHKVKQAKRLLKIAGVLKEGAEKYEANNWRLIPQEEHLNHAIIHWLAYSMGDISDNHLDHFLTRIMMAYATEPSKGFSYDKYNKVDIQDVLKEVKEENSDKLFQDFVEASNGDYVKKSKLTKIGIDSYE